MKTFLMFLLSAAGLFGGACSSIQTGSNVYGPSGAGVSWGSFVAGTPTSTFRQNISNAPVDPNSATWMTRLGESAHNIWLGNPVSTSDNYSESWIGSAIHYVHGDTQRRISFRGNPSWSKTALTGSMTSGSAVLTAGPWLTVQGRQTPYFSKSDVGLAVSVAGACSGLSSTCLYGTLGGNPETVYIASVQSPTQATLSVAATTTVSGAQVNVGDRSTSGVDSDPGTVPMPFAPRIEQWYGPMSRPFDSVFLDRYLATDTSGANNPGDQHIFVVDTDNCISYEMWDCYDDYSSFSCSEYAAFSLTSGDLQRPYSLTSANVAGMPDVFGTIHYNEFASGTINHAISTTVLAGNITTAYTGAASHAQCCGAWSTNQIPFGAKLRLKSTFNSSGYPASCAPLWPAMQNYGLIVVDGGTNGALRQRYRQFVA